VHALAEAWFAPIPAGEKQKRILPTEPQQQEAREATVNADVPLNALYKAWHIAERLSQPYYATDLITEIMGNGYASRLYRRLVKEQRLFSSINCYHTGSLDAGLLVIEGKIAEDKMPEEANTALEMVVAELCMDGVTEEELQKAKNKIETMIEFEDMSILSRANNLAFYEMLGNAQMINEEWLKYQAVSTASLQETARHIFRKENSNTLYYLKQRPN
jgi:predicted Zn-dependent peptidase